MNRAIEFVLAALGLAVSTPLIVLLIPVIRVDSPGPGLFRQQRVGRNQKVFTLYKLRTMTTDTKQSGSHEVSSLSVTSVGGFLRRSKLDELPQLVNVLRGEMSLVGPRPCLPVQQALIYERERHSVFVIRPGITGLAQVRGVDMSDPERLARCDAEYVSKRSLAFDMRLILQTLRGEGRGDRVAN